MRAASSRAIIAAAGQRHNSAITYHFGDRDSLFDAVWVRGTAVVNGARRQLLAQRNVLDLDLPALVDIYLSPFAAYLDSRSPSYWARFNEEALRHYPLLVASHLHRQLDRYTGEQPLDTLYGVFELMQRRVGIDADPDPALRVSVMVRAVIATFAAWERDAQAGRTDSTARALVSALQATALGILRADSASG